MPLASPRELRYDRAMKNNGLHIEPMQRVASPPLLDFLVAMKHAMDEDVMKLCGLPIRLLYGREEAVTQSLNSQPLTLETVHEVVHKMRALPPIHERRILWAIEASSIVPPETKKTWLPTVSHPLLELDKQIREEQP